MDVDGSSTLNPSPAVPRSGQDRLELSMVQKIKQDLKNDLIAGLGRI
ncbi:MAG: hypothetical protein ACKO5P_02530 [Nodosilinea sp.]